MPVLFQGVDHRSLELSLTDLARSENAPEHPSGESSAIAGAGQFGVERCSGEIYNVGGGRALSVSLLELTDLCRERCGREVPIGHAAETPFVDVPLYLTDHAKVTSSFGWAPSRAPRAVVDEIASWIEQNAQELRLVFGDR
jgi:nucleoside-diphosphate-sugar epimerase